MAWCPGSVEGLPRTKIIAATADYIYAKCTSAVFGFVDDLELHLRIAEGVIAGEVGITVRLQRSRRLIAGGLKICDHY